MKASREAPREDKRGITLALRVSVARRDLATPEQENTFPNSLSRISLFMFCFVSGLEAREEEFPVNFQFRAVRFSLTFCVTFSSVLIALLFLFVFFFCFFLPFCLFVFIIFRYVLSIDHDGLILRNGKTEAGRVERCLFVYQSSTSLICVFFTSIPLLCLWTLYSLFGYVPVCLSVSVSVSRPLSLLSLPLFLSLLSLSFPSPFIYIHTHNILSLSYFIPSVDVKEFYNYQGELFTNSVVISQSSFIMIMKKKEDIFMMYIFFPEPLCHKDQVQ